MESKTIITKDWRKCPSCGVKTETTGNPIYCLSCGTRIVRMS